MQIDDKTIQYERRRSAKFVTIVYAVMALAFSMTALTLTHASTQLAIPSDTATFLAAAFVTLAAANLAILEVLQRIFDHRY